MRIGVMQRLLVLAIVLIFAIAAAILAIGGEAPLIAVLFSLFSLLGSAYTLNSNLVNVSSSTYLLLSVFFVAGNLILTILLTSIFYELLGGFDVRYVWVKARVKRMHGHVIITPINELGLSLYKKLAAEGKRAVLIDKDVHKVRRAIAVTTRIYAINADPESVESLKSANVMQASYVVTLGKVDMDNALVALTAKKMNSKLKVISRIGRLEDIPKFKKFGISRVVMPERAMGKEVGSFLVSKG